MAHVVHAPRPQRRTALDIKATAAKQAPAEYLGRIIARHESLAGVATELGVTRKTVENWVRRYDLEVVRA